MFAGWSESLGIKEGLAEFRAQLRSDGRAIAEEKGLDLSRLDALEETIASRKEEVCSAAYNVLTHDETLAQLLDLRQDPQPDPEDPLLTPPAPSAACTAPPTMGTPTAEGAVHSSAVADSGAEAVAAAAGAQGIAPGASATEPGTRTVHQSSTRKIAALEADIQRSRQTADAAQAELSQTKVQLQTLEAQCAELSAISDEALSQSQSLRREMGSWRQHAEERQRQLEAAELERERLDRELAEARERLEGVAKQPEQDLQARELLGEVEYLRRALEVKEQRLQEAVKEKDRALQREVAGKTLARDPEHGLMLNAHTAIAAAFGDSLSGPPIVRWLDEPLVRLTALLFQYRHFRRAFYSISTLVWVYSLYHIIAVPHQHE